MVAFQIHKFSYELYFFHSGVLSRNKLEEFLTGPPFEVELHDRDRRADIIKPMPKIFDIHGNEEHLFDTSGEFKVYLSPF